MIAIGLPNLITVTEVRTGMMTGLTELPDRWRSHLDSISGKYYAEIASLARLRRTGANTSLIVQIYSALFEQKLTHGVALSGGSYANVVRSAQVLQNYAIRAITGQSRDASVSQWYSKFRRLRVNQLAVLKQAILAFKAIQGSVAPNGPFEFVRHPAGPGNYRLPKIRLTTSDHSPKCRLLKI